MGLGLSWNYLFASEPGTSHVRAGTRCQDDVSVSVEPIRDEGQLLAIFVSDGAGSASRGGIGAETAIQASLDALAEIRDQRVALDRDLAQRILTVVRDAINREAAQAGLTPRDYACTYLAVLSAPSLGTLLIQVGDGGIVTDTGRGLECHIEPMNGEYANSTRFVTEGDALEVVDVRVLGDQILRAAVFTDGLHALSIDQSTNTPHEPFFRPFFAALEKPNPVGEDADHPLQPALQRFLNSERVNQRTDDDKALALAVWHVENAEQQRTGEDAP